MPGQSDIFNLDTVSAHCTVSMIELPFTRQLYQYRDVANFAQQIKPVPDAAAGYPAITAASSNWAKANEQVTRDVADVPLISQRWAVFHSARLHGCTFFVYALNCDPANIWLSGS